MQELIPVIAGIVIAGIAFLGTWLGRRGVRENDLIDQLQEELTVERGANRERISKLEETVTQLQREVLRLLSRDAQWSIHLERVEGQVIVLGGVPLPRPQALMPDAHSWETPPTPNTD